MKQSKNTSFLLCFVLIFLFATWGYGQDEEVAKFPNRPINFIVPLPAGDAADLVQRMLGKHAEKYLGQPVVIVNKPGGGLSIGTAAIATAKPDGYTIGFAGSSALFVVPHTEKVPYHPLTDFTYIVQVGAIINGVVVKADSPFTSFKDLIAFARQNPKKVTYGVTGIGSMQNIIMEQIARKEKVQLTPIPFKGTAEWQVALLGGHIFAGAGTFNYSTLESGQIRLLLLYLEEKSADYPGVPILKELGYDIPCPLIFNVSGPKGIPDGIAKKLEDAYSKAAREPEFVRKMKEELHQTVSYRNSKELTEYVAHTYRAWETYLKEAGLTK